jgi:outer membrane protein OmpA-like peptidoglycan-associated protein
MARFCGQCGSPVGEVQFCSKCGARLPATVPGPAAVAPTSPVAAAPAAPASVAPVAVAPATQPASQGSSVIVKVLVGFLVFILLIVLAVMGSCVYIGYRAKKKADEISQAYKSNNLDKLAGALGVGSSNSDSGSSRGSSGSGGSSSSASAPLSFPVWTPPSAGAGTRVPLRPGLTVVTAVAQFGGDYESIKQIQQVNATSVRLSYRADNVPNPLEGLQKLSGEKAPKTSGTISGQRLIRNQDLQSAHDYMQWFSPNQPEVMPGSTAISVSREVLTELKNKGETQFSFRAGGLKGMAGSLLGALGQMAGGGALGAPKEAQDLASMGKEECTLKRAGNGLASFPVLLNDQRVSLPAVHAQCSTDDGLADFYFLDDLDNPLALAWKLGEAGDTLQLVKISYPLQMEAQSAPGRGAAASPQAAPAGSGGSGGGGQQIEQELKQTGQAEVYGIYFDFASDKIKPESEPVLREIADALDHNPTWKLRVEGHTDNIGGNDYNMDLSQRRAEAVKLALVTRYHIAAARLTPQGFGATRPKESNDTLAGRARNRRVELVRE